MSGDDIVYMRAMERKEELEAELREINTFLSVRQRFLLQAAMSPLKATLVGVSGTGGHIAESVTEETGRPPSMTQDEFTEFARDILLEHGRPMTRGQLLAAFKARGRHIGGADEQKNLGTKIWRARDRIVNVPGAGYWPKEIPCEAVKYDPTAAVSEEPADPESDDRADRFNEVFQ